MSGAVTVEVAIPHKPCGFCERKSPRKKCLDAYGMLKSSMEWSVGFSVWTLALPLKSGMMFRVRTHELTLKGGMVASLF